MGNRIRLMASTFRFSTGLWCTVGVVVVCGAISSALYRHSWDAFDISAPQPKGNAETRELPQAAIASPPHPQLDWSVFVRTADGNEPAAKPTPLDRYRLAGTFIREEAGGVTKPRAIIDDTVSSDELIVGEGDALGGALVAKIEYDKVTLQTSAGARVLRLEFSSAGAGTQAESGATNLLGGTAEAATNRFGCVKVRDGRWQFSRQPLLDYYQELLDEPDRMVAVFDTMKPVRDQNNRITGYMVGIEGEKEFFAAVGLHEGDVVREVNSVAMTNRRRAEFFIDEFLKNRMNAVVLDVEREGKRIKQVYQMKE